MLHSLVWFKVLYSSLAILDSQLDLPATLLLSLQRMVIRGHSFVFVRDSLCGLELKLSLSWQRAYLAGTKAWVWLPETHKPGMAVLAFNPSTWEMQAQGSEIHGHPQLHMGFKASLGFVKLCLREGGVCEEMGRMEINTDNFWNQILEMKTFIVFFSLF